MPIMEAYRDVADGTREFARDMNGNQAGDPYKAARAIDLIVEDVIRLTYIPA